MQQCSVQTGLTHLSRRLLQFKETNTHTSTTFQISEDISSDLRHVEDFLKETLHVLETKRCWFRNQIDAENVKGKISEAYLRTMQIQSRIEQFALSIDPGRIPHPGQRQDCRNFHSLHYHYFHYHYHYNGLQRGNSSNPNSINNRSSGQTNHNYQNQRRIQLQNSDLANPERDDSTWVRLSSIREFENAVSLANSSTRERMYQVSSSAMRLSQKFEMNIYQAEALLLALSRFGDARASYELFHAYCAPNSALRNRDKRSGIYHFETALRANEPRALFSASQPNFYLYQQSRNHDYNPRQASYFLSAAARKGYAPAMYNRWLEDKRGLRHLLVSAADQKLPQAAFALAKQIEGNDINTSADKNRIQELYSTAAISGSIPAAYFKRGLFYHFQVCDKDFSIERDLAMKRKACEKYAVADIPVAWINRAVLLVLLPPGHVDDGVNIYNERENRRCHSCLAESLLNRVLCPGSEHNDNPVDRNMKMIAHYNMAQISNDESKRLEHFIYSANRGHVISQFNAGILYKRLNYNYEYSFNMFYSASQQNYPQASFNLGVLSRDTGDFGGTVRAFSHVVRLTIDINVSRPKSRYRNCRWVTDAAFVLGI